VTCILEHDGKILVLKRSNQVGTYRGLWGGVAGYVEEFEDPYDTALKEIREEAGVEVDAIELIRKGTPLEFSDMYDGKKYDWIVYPFLFRLQAKELVRIDWEHEEYRWVYPSEVKKMQTVPGLDDVIRQLLGNTDAL
jgi:8-oxo-dGTP diphosphatase